MSPDRSESASSSGRRPRRGGLGRGLESLIPTQPMIEDVAAPQPVTSSDGTPLLVPIDSISPNPWQPRVSMDEHQLQELAVSIRTHGVMQPLVVMREESGDRYTLIAGERRWRASRLAGKTEVPVVIQNVSPQAMLELAIVENVVRADLSPLEEAMAYKQLIEEFGLTQGDVAERVGRSRVSITNTLRLLNAPESVRRALADNEVTEGHVRALLGLPSIADQIALLDVIRDKGLSVRQTEEQVRAWQTGTRAARTQEREPGDPEAHRIEQRLRDALGTRVALKRTGDKPGGSITIQFYSDEHLQGIFDRLIGEDMW